MLKLNCDIGERGIAHPIDDQLMSLIDIANIACSGHAGDIDSINYYANLAKNNNVEITAHLSYPDRINFGRNKQDIAIEQLIQSLTEQYSLLPCGKIKFHGALYHAVNTDRELALAIGEWLVKNNVELIIAPQYGYLSDFCHENGIMLCQEGFIERGYELVEQRLQLIPRGQVGAEINSIDEAYEQYCQFETGILCIAGIAFEMMVDTLCIHSDSRIALELLQLIRNNSNDN